ncbi:phage tail protein [uncultured Sphingomonas sp.]|uniref:phage tail protein n=1 Tax=uncultured Sphingomonas sp. TaxID=158754 RepID=UPI0025F43EE9|nr:phage tail protein [uncultured Sphingomonas sp.]
MATLVLTTVGSLVAGPIGGAIGAVLGNQLDRAVLKPKGRQGPRLGDLGVQTSAYGSRIPKLFGTMRVAGSVIWATDLREEAHRSGGGKRGGATTSYSYSASFAVALSARPIRRVGRIWADGKLLRGAAGDWKSETGFRLYLGSEDQPVDPLIASAEGIGAAPAHRGIAYAVFEAMQLADYGNRIPSLTFEVEADPEPAAVAAIARELSGGRLQGTGGPALGGFAASGDSVRGALEALTALCPMALCDDGRALRINDAAVRPIDRGALGTGHDATRQPAHVRDRKAAATLPDAVAIAYYDPARDYQAGLQRARRDGIARREERIDLPAAIGASAVRGLAEDALARRWRERNQAMAHLPWRMLEVRAGARVALDDATWRVAGWSLEKMALTLSLRGEGKSFAPVPPVDPGRVTPAPDLASGETRLELFELPALDDVLATAPQVVLAAAGTRPGWRRASVGVSLDGGASWREAGGTALPATMGRTLGRLATGPTTVFDHVTTVEVELLHDAMMLQNADAPAVAGGANLALIGGELVQFMRADQVAATRYRLSGLLRGRRGTEQAVDSHGEGERFVLIDARTLLPIPVPLSSLGATLTVSAQASGDGGADIQAACPIEGLALRSPRPVQLAIRRLADGTLRIAWTRRSRLGWAWLDGGDVPLAEDREAYRLVLSLPGNRERVIELAEPRHDYAPDAQRDDGVGRGTAIGVAVRQIGTHAPSDTVTGIWTL